MFRTFKIVVRSKSVLILSTLALYGCVGKGPLPYNVQAISVDYLHKNRNYYNGKYIRVEGYISDFGSLLKLRAGHIADSGFGNPSCSYDPDGPEDLWIDARSLRNKKGRAKIGKKLFRKVILEGIFLDQRRDPKILEEMPIFTGGIPIQDDYYYGFGPLENAKFVQISDEYCSIGN